LDLLFLHPNFPGQFRRLAQALAQESGVRVWGMGDASWIGTGAGLPGVEVIRYPAVAAAPEEAHPWVRGFEQSVRRGVAVIERLAELKRGGFEPDVIVTHPGWGDAYFVRDYFPGADVIGLFEYYYRPRGADVGFDPEFPTRVEDIFRLHVTNSAQLLALESCHRGVCPTPWQKGLYPAAYQSRLQVLHEGIDTTRVAPHEGAQFTLPDGRTLSKGDEVLTFVSRCLEPYRGFHQFMRALPRILRERPQAQVLVLGENSAHYGPKPPGAGGWKEVYQAQLRDQVDWQRVHFLGALPYDRYLSVLQVSSAHVYLTYPFILSWSMLEAMSAGCLLIASDTAPVRDVVQDGENGFLFDFFDTAALARLAIEALSDPEAFADVGKRARQTIVDRYDFRQVCLPRYRALIGLT
jgi:glycosyltransferase involved in cell wall biosynthesis